MCTEINFQKTINHLKYKYVLEYFGIGVVPPETREGFTVSFDGKTVCSTNKMEKYKSHLHIVSAHIAELGITFGQQAVYARATRFQQSASL